MSIGYKKLVSQCVREFHSQGQVYFEDYIVRGEMQLGIGSRAVLQLGLLHYELSRTLEITYTHWLKNCKNSLL